MDLYLDGQITNKITVKLIRDFVVWIDRFDRIVFASADNRSFQVAMRSQERMKDVADAMQHRAFVERNAIEPAIGGVCPRSDLQSSGITWSVEHKRPSSG